MSGVYALWDEDVLIYYGRAEGSDGLRGSLMADKNGEERPCARAATHFQIEFESIVMTLRERQAILLLEYFRESGTLPRCNLLSLGDPE